MAVMETESLLFSAFQLGSLRLPNRIVMAPLTRARSNDDGVPPVYAAKYYSERASAGPHHFIGHKYFGAGTWLCPYARHLDRGPSGGMETDCGSRP
jgi:NADH:flavin oxidoreductase / NADH oxidase family